MTDILIAEGELRIDDSLLSRLEQKVPTVRWRELDDQVRQAYARHLILLDEDLRQTIFKGELTEPVAFYNAYYWALMFAKRYQALYGSDAGVEQEAFKVLERAPSDVDWAVVEQISEAVQGRSNRPPS